MESNSSELLEHVKGALRAVYDALAEKGAATRQQVSARADFSTVGDGTANDALVAYFKKSGLPAIMYTEELEEPLKLGSNQEYSIIADDVDGTANQSYGFGMLPHGSIVGIAEVADPRFSDIKAAGYLEINSGNMFYAEKGRGAYLIEGWAKENSSKTKLHSSGVSSMKQMKNVIADVYMLGEIATVFNNFIKVRGGDFRSKGAHLALTAAGMVDVFISGDNAPNPKKHATGEEIGPFYLILNEAGATMLDWNGKSIENEKIGMGEKKAFHVIAAATEHLGKEFTAWMKEQRELKEYMAAKGL